MMVRDFPSPLLQFDQLSVLLPHGSDRRHAVQEASFALQRDEIVCVVGESGSGKSVIANAAMGLLPATLHIDGGRILWRGQDLLRASESQMQALRGKDIAMIFQEPLSALNPVMTVGQQIAETIQVHGGHSRAAIRARVLELLALVGLPQPQRLQHAYPFKLSGGQRQRVVIAMALALEPALLICDEPTTALDVSTQAQILQLIRTIQQKMGMAVLFITHDFGVVADIADRVVVLEQGRVVEQGPATQVLNHARHPYTRSLIAAVPTGQAQVRHIGGAPILQVQHLSKHFVARHGLWRGEKITAVDNVSLSVRRGETIGIVGESGSGKSTLGKCLVRLLDSDSGRILFDGEDIAALSARALRPLRKDIQMIFQDPFASLNPRHTIGRIVMAGPLANGVAPALARQRAQQLLQRVGLDENTFDRYPAQFSGGQRQRIGIARALALEPKVLVADESVSALDVSVQAQVLTLLQELQSQLQIALIFITHDLRVAAQICDQVAVMHRGRIVEIGPPARILKNPVHDYTNQLIASIPGTHWIPSVPREQWEWSMVKWAI